MNKAGELHLAKLKESLDTGDPSRMAIITYHAFRESPQAKMLRDMDQESYDICALASINHMSEILQKLEWEDYKVAEFLIVSKELAGLKL